MYTPFCSSVLRAENVEDGGKGAGLKLSSTACDGVGLLNSEMQC